MSILFLSEEYGRWLHQHFQVASAGAFDWAESRQFIKPWGRPNNSAAECLKGIAQATEFPSERSGQPGSVRGGGQLGGDGL